MPAMPSEHEVYDAGRDAVALLRAHLAGDEQAKDAILGGAQLVPVIHTLCGMTIGALQALATAAGVPEADIDRVVDQQMVNFLQQPDSETPGQP